MVNTWFRFLRKNVNFRLQAEILNVMFFYTEAGRIKVLIKSMRTLYDKHDTDGSKLISAQT